MLLEYFYPQLYIIKHILCFIENHPVLIGVMSTVVASSLWFRKFIRQKRAEAFFDFYSKLSLRLKSIQEILNEKGLLNTTDIEAGNIYSLMYNEETLKSVCPKFKLPNDEQMKHYTSITREIKKLLLENNNNVYPPRASRKKWYESQYVLLSFCEFLENTHLQSFTNIESNREDANKKHTNKCEKLITAITYLLEAINNAKY